VAVKQTKQFLRNLGLALQPQAIPRAGIRSFEAEAHLEKVRLTLLSIGARNRLRDRIDDFPSFWIDQQSAAATETVRHLRFVIVETAFDRHLSMLSQQHEELRLGLTVRPNAVRWSHRVHLKATSLVEQIHSEHLRDAFPLAFRNFPRADPQVFVDERSELTLP
jgi:hypothetical protein